MLMYNMPCHHCIHWKEFPTTCAMHCTFIMIELNVIMWMLCFIVQLVTSSAIARFIRLAFTFVTNILLYCHAWSVGVLSYCQDVLAQSHTGYRDIWHPHALYIKFEILSVCLKLHPWHITKKSWCFYSRWLLKLSFHGEWFNHNIYMKSTFIHVCIAGELWYHLSWLWIIIALSVI